MLIIWLQGIWLPLHGYSFSDTPLWAGIFLLPLTAGFLVSGPVSGILSDRFGSRGIATAGMTVFGGSFIGLMLVPVNFPYWAFALLIAVNGIGSGMFAAPNSSSIMGSVPARHRGAASGMRSTFQNSGTALSIGVFFSLMIAGLAGQLAEDADRRPGAARRPARRRPPDRFAAPGVLAVRRRAGGQSGTAPAGVGPRAGHPPGRQPADPHRPGILPRAHLGAVPPGPGRGVRGGRRAGRGGGPRVSAARRALCPAGVRARAGRTSARPGHDNPILTEPAACALLHKALPRKRQVRRRCPVRRPAGAGPPAPLRVLVVSRGRGGGGDAGRGRAGRTGRRRRRSR